MAQLPHTLTYRAEIDGLRALAIVGVLAYHFGLAGAKGGFAGVDVFFVISGYLMTAILLGSQMDWSDLSKFWTRRFWRIAPAYFICIAVTLSVGSVWLLPGDAKRLGASAAASAIFGANIFFASGNGYFDTAAIYQPLLHLWSLSTETQFYLVWPFVIFGLRRLPQGWQVPIIGAICLASLAACQILSVTDAKVAFFSLPTRLWQFVAGSLVAFPQLQLAASRRKQWYSPAVAIAILAITAPMFLIEEGDLWPAPWSLPTVLGTVAILRYGGLNNFASNLLRARPVQFVGKISYSLYLVHWPLIVLVGYAQYPSMPTWERTLVAAACFPAAWLAFRYVEIPMRALGRRPLQFDWHLAARLTVPVILALAGLAVRAMPGRFSIWPATAQESLADLQDDACIPWKGSPEGANFCLIGSPERSPDTLVWGDSHALQLLPGLAKLALAEQRTFIVSAKDACPPVEGVNRVSTRFAGPGKCAKANEAALQAALQQPGIRRVVLAARWAFYGETTRFGDERGGRSFLTDYKSRELSQMQSRQLLHDHLLDELAQILAAGKKVVLVAQVPEMGFDAARCYLMRQTFSNDADACAVGRAAVTERQKFSTALLAEAAVLGNVRIADPLTILCDQKSCKASLSGQAAYRDDNHLSSYAAKIIVMQLLGQGL